MFWVKMVKGDRIGPRSVLGSSTFTGEMYAEIVLRDFKRAYPGRTFVKRPVYKTTKSGRKVKAWEIWEKKKKW